MALVAAAPAAADPGLAAWARDDGVARFLRGFNRPTDIVGVAPRIARMGSDGGPTQTLALRKGDAAINTAKRSTAPKNDRAPHERTHEGHREGRATTDPQAFFDGGLLAPLGSPGAPHKGFGLALLVDALSGVLSGGGFARHVTGGPAAAWRILSARCAELDVDPPLPSVG